MLTIRNLKKGVQNPVLARKYFTSKFGRKINSICGINYLKKDWDNLILLDACRYDLFKQVNVIDGELSSIRSNASSSEEFFEKNIEGNSHGDIVYYSANPHIDNIDASFHEMYRLWDDEATWNGSIGTVPPNEAVNKVIDTVDEHNDKRVILHMMQPHRPFLGDLAEDFDQSGFARRGVNIAHDKSEEIPFWWKRLEAGSISRNRVLKMYKQTLEVALPHVQRLVNYLPGKTVISADHGNVFGERGMSGKKMYGHPLNTHHKKLVTVPWLEIPKPRKRIVVGKSNVSSRQKHFENATEQLEALGYIQ